MKKRIFFFKFLNPQKFFSPFHIVNALIPTDLGTPGDQWEAAKMYAVLHGLQGWEESQSSIIRLWQEEHRTTISLLLLTEPKCKVLLASNIKWQTVNVFKALIQQHP